MFFSWKIPRIIDWLNWLFDAWNAWENTLIRYANSFKMTKHQHSICETSSVLCYSPHKIDKFKRLMEKERARKSEFFQIKCGYSTLGFVYTDCKWYLSQMNDLSALISAAKVDPRSRCVWATFSLDYWCQMTESNVQLTDQMHAKQIHFKIATYQFHMWR